MNRGSPLVILLTVVVHCCEGDFMTKAKTPSKLNLEPAGPLWQRVPTKDEEGRPLGDFMMLIPRFNRWPQVKQASALQAIEAELNRFSERVVFADFNTKLNLLWISMRPEKGVMMALVCALQKELPEAVLIASKAEMMMGASARPMNSQARLR